jgi:PPOX class probable FMN-dependent enzyme
MKQKYVIQDQAELEALLGAPNKAVAQKVAKKLDSVMSRFIENSPLIYIATSDNAGLIDISPKGDAPGFVHVDQHGSLLIPERPGNKLMFGFRNLLVNKSIGLIFVVPNTRETLRVKGHATISRDPDLLGSLSDKGKPALLCTYVDIQECFFHCGKAMIRSKLWQPESWGLDEHLMAQYFANKHQISKDQIESDLEQSYRDNLY